jgi:O-antigen/teichoic acid export membrane protein
MAGIILLSQFAQAFTAAIKPAISELDAKDDKIRVKQIAFLTQKYSLIIILPSVCFFILFGRQFLELWVGDKFTDPSIVQNMSIILAILAIGHGMRLAQHSNFLVLVGLGAHRIFGLLTALSAFICVILSIISLDILDLGLIGIAFANVIPLILLSGIVLIIYFNKKMNITSMESIREVWWPALLGTFPAIIAILTWKFLLPANSWYQILSLVFGSVTLTGISSWFFTLCADERRHFLSAISVKLE